MSFMVDWLTYLLYSLLWKTMRLLPEPMAYRFFDFLAHRSYRRNGKRVRRLRENYQMVVPTADSMQIEHLVLKGLQNSMRYWCDTFRIADWDQAKTLNTVSTLNDHLLFEGLASGDGVIIALPHAGNWDHAGLFFSAKGVTVHTVAEHLKPDRLFAKFLEHRANMGLVVLDIEERVTDQLEAVLRGGGLVALVADRDLSKSGIDVDFFGANARMPAGPALLAHRTGARLITAFVGFRQRGIEIKFAGPFEVDDKAIQREEVQRVTQLLARQFQSDIASDPTSWHMLQRIFVDRVVDKS